MTTDLHTFAEKHPWYAAGLAILFIVCALTLIISLVFACVIGVKWATGDSNLGNVLLLLLVMVTFRVCNPNPSRPDLVWHMVCCSVQVPWVGAYLGWWWR